LVVLVYKPGLQGYHISHPIITSCWSSTWRMRFTSGSHTQEKLLQWVQSVDHIIGNDEIIWKARYS